MKDNFFLLDVMGTDHSHLISEYLNRSGLPLDMTPSYYKLHRYDLDSYKRKFAIIDHRIANMDLWDNEEYWRELKHRINVLKAKNFVFLLGQPWEFVENLDSFNATALYHSALKDTKHLVWDGYVDWNWFYLQHSHSQSKFEFDHSHKTKDFLYLNKRSRPHREALFRLLKSNDILHNSIYSYVDRPFHIKLDPTYELYDDTKEIVDIPEFIGDKAKLRYGLDHNLQVASYNHSTASIVSESTVSKKRLFFSEKIWKPIVAKHIFILHGQTGSLAQLKKMGYKTFNGIIDESYDHEQDESKKTEKILSACRQLLKHDPIDVYKETAQIRQHNHELFFNKQKLSEVIKDRLMLFFEFFDSGKVSS